MNDTYTATLTVRAPAGTSEQHVRNVVDYMAEIPEAGWSAEVATVAMGSETARMQARIDQLTKANEDLSRKLNEAWSSNGALMVDADRREQRARLIAQSCPEHGEEITYLRHMTSWYWESMNVSDQARMAIVGALGNVVLSIRQSAMPGNLKATDVADWLDKCIDAQKRPLKRQGYPTLADCIRAGGCEHEALSDEVKADIVKTLGLLPTT